MAEKKRLEEELRIAREIQMSLLPQGPLGMPGLAMTAHCVLRRAKWAATTTTSCRSTTTASGVLIADVSGKGTSAALYMAELKGLMLSLSQIHMSPRALLIAANRIIADEPRQPQLHHDDLRDPRSRGADDDLRPRRAHAADPPAGSAGRADRRGCSRPAAWCSA